MAWSLKFVKITKKQAILWLPSQTVYPDIWHEEVVLEFENLPQRAKFKIELHTVPSEL